MTDFWAGGVSQGSVPVPKIDWDEVRRKQAAARDPYNKKKPVQRAAQNRIKAAAAPKAAAPAAPPPKTSKQLLDEYRAANNGALPPGMSPEVAALIDSGVDLEALKTSNPLAAGAIQAIQAQLLSMPSAYDASRSKITADYNRLTGDVETAGADWMKQLYGNVAPGSDEVNAAQFAADPAFANYANTLGRIEETGDVNEATDLAWFTKNQQAQQAYLQSLLTGVAGGTIPVGAVEEAGGGGGGGGGGRGRRGGGGGSGGSGEWNDPTTTLTDTNLLSEDIKRTVEGNNPDLWPGLQAAAGGDPELEGFFYDLFTGLGEQPVPIQKGAKNELTAVEEEIAQLAQQDLLNRTYNEGAAARPNQLIQDYRNERGFKQDPIEKDERGRAIEQVWDEGNPQHKRWYVPPDAPQRTQIATPEQTERQTTAQQMITLQDQMSMDRIAGLLGHQPGESAVRGKLGTSAWNQLKQLQTDYDIKKRTADEDAWAESHESDEPFPKGEYTGYTAPIDPEELEEAKWRENALIKFRQAMYELDRNISPQLTKVQGTTTQSQDSKAQSQQKQTGENAPTVYGNMNFPDAPPAPNFLPGETLPRHELLTAGEEIPLDPITGVPIEQEEPETTYVGAGLEGRGFPVPTEKYEEAQNLAAAARNRMERERASGGASLMSKALGGFGTPKTKAPKMKAPSKAAVAEANQPTRSKSKTGTTKRQDENVPPTAGASSLEMGQQIRNKYKSKKPVTKKTKTYKGPVKRSVRGMNRAV